LVIFAVGLGAAGVLTGRAAAIIETWFTSKSP
jgi:hypothetical protein